MLDPSRAAPPRRRRRKARAPRPYQPNVQCYEHLNLSDWSFDHADVVVGEPDNAEIDRILDDLFPGTRGGVRSIRFDSDAASIPVLEDADQIEHHFGYLDDADLPARSNAEIRERRARRAEEARTAAEEAADAQRVIQEILDAKAEKAAARAARIQAVLARKQLRVDRRTAQARAEMLARVQADERAAANRAAKEAARKEARVARRMLTAKVKADAEAAAKAARKQARVDTRAALAKAEMLPRVRADGRASAERAAKEEARIAKRRDAAKLKADAKAAAKAAALNVATRNAKARAATQRPAAVAAAASARPESSSALLASQLSLPSWGSIDVQRVRWRGSKMSQKDFLAQVRTSLPADCVRWRIRNGVVPFAEIIASVMTGAGRGARLLLFHEACEGVAAIDVRCSRPALVAEWSRLIAPAVAMLPSPRTHPPAAVMNEVANLRVDLSVSTLVECLNALGLGLCVGSVGG